jgi:hypothetical protein
MRITAEKTIRPLGLEFPTGRLALMESNELKYILHAKDGLLVVQYFAPPDITIDSLRYTFQNNTLVLTDRYSSQTYRPIMVGSQLTEPIQAVMNVTIDSTRVRSLRVAPVVPVYLSKLHPSHLQFHAVIPDGSVRIDLQGFTGVGSYALGPGDGLLMLIDGDVVFTFTTDSLATGIMSIDEYDEATSRCAGRFAFTVRTPGPHGPPITRQLSEGSFSAPVYR